jgi:hypothetical protein
MSGITTLEDLKGYFFIDEDGCWIWKGGYSQAGYVPVAHVSKSLLPELGKSQRTFSAYRAAWLLTGKKIPAGHVVYRSVCLNHKCVNPDHCKTGTKAQMHARYSASGKNKGDPHRVIVNMKNRKTQFTSAARVAEIQTSIDAGMKVRDMTALHKTDAGTIRKICAGLHPTQLGSTLAHPNSSIFTIGRMAA